MKKNTKWIVFAVIAILLLIPLFKEMSDNKKPKGITYTGFIENLKNNKEVIVYINTNKGVTNEAILNNLNILKNNSEYNFEMLDYETLSTEEKTEIVKFHEDILELPAFVFINENKIKGVRTGAFTPSELNILASKYFKNSNVDVNYLVAGDAEQFINRAKEDKPVVLIIGSSNCSYCENFKPLFNQYPLEYKVDLYYFDTDYYQEKELYKILEKYDLLGVSPTTEQQCNKTGKTEKLINGFGTPVTLIIKNDKTVDCMSGFNPDVTPGYVGQIFKKYEIKKIVTEPEKKPKKK